MSGNGTATFTFHYTSDTSASDYAGWTFFIGKSINTTNVWDTWITCRGYNGGYYGADGLAGTRASSNTYNGTLTAASCTEADVVMTVTRAAGVITAVAAVDPTNGDADYTITWTYTYGGSEDATKDLYLSFAVDKAYLSISNVTGAGIITTQADIDFSNAIVDGAVAGTLGSLSVGSGEKTDNGELRMLGDNNTFTIPSSAYAGSRDIVNVSFDLCIGNLTQRQTWFYMYGSDDKDAGYFRVGVYSGTIDTNLGFTSSGVVRNAGNTPAIGNRTHFEVVLNYATGNITTTITPYTNGTAGTATTETVSMINSNPLKTIKFGDNYNTRYSLLDNLIIKTTKGDYSVSEVGYTVKFVDGNGTAVKADDTSREAVAGTAISDLASLTDRATFYNDGDIANNAADDFAGATNKYNYKSISATNSSLEAITELEAGAIVTIVYDKYNKYEYAVKQKLGDAEATDKETGTLWGDEEFSCYFPKGIKSGDDYYFTEANASSPYFKATVTAANPTKTINYAIDPTVAFYSEGEDLASKTAEYTHFASDMANGSSGVLNGEDGNLITSLSAGIYTITARTIGRGNNDDHKIHFYKSAVDNANKLLTCSPSNSGYTETSDAFALTGATDILIKGAQGGGANGNGLDYVIITKLPDNVSATVTAAGYATYVNSDYDLDFSATSIKAYKVKVNPAGEARLTKVEKVPAGTPMLLYKEGGATEDIPVTTGAAAVTDNDLVAGTGAAVATDGGTVEEVAYTNMILNNGSDGIGFYFANGQTVASNRAYLHIASTLAPTAASRMVMKFADDEETNGISSLTPALSEGEGAVFNLQGQRVNQPAKGLYIVNGRKVVIK